MKEERYCAICANYRPGVPRARCLAEEVNRNLPAGDVMPVMFASRDAELCGPSRRYFKEHSDAIQRPADSPSGDYR